MPEIKSNDQFYSELSEAMTQTQRLMQLRPDKQRPLEDIELQLDIMRRRTAEGQMPTAEEKRVITVAGVAHEHFPPGPGPQGINRDRETLTYRARLNQLNYYYVNWPGSEPLDDDL